MNTFFHNDTEFDRLYNCSFYNITDISLEERASVPIGGLIFMLSLIEAVYF